MPVLELPGEVQEWHAVNAQEICLLIECSDASVKETGHTAVYVYERNAMTFAVGRIDPLIEFAEHVLIGNAVEIEPKEADRFELRY